MTAITITPIIPFLPILSYFHLNSHLLVYPYTPFATNLFLLVFAHRHIPYNHQHCLINLLCLHLHCYPLSPYLKLIPNQQLTLLPLSHCIGSGGSKIPFRIDAKLFSFSFNGGWHDSYAIHESSRHVKHTIWVGRKGLELILSCFANIRDRVLGKVPVCKRFRDNNKLLEFCGRSNKAGVFVVIAEYFGGAH